MFMVGDILWLEGEEYICDVPDLQNFSGCVHYLDGVKFWFDKGLLQSPQDPATGEWLPAQIFPNNRKCWYDKDKLQSFQDPKTKEWMPARIWSDGTIHFYDKGQLQSFQDPKTKEWMPAVIWDSGEKWWYDKGVRILE